MAKDPKSEADRAKKAKPAVENPPKLAALLAKLPAADVATAAAICKQIIAGSPGHIEKLVGLVGQEFGLREGVKPKYALHGAAIYASRPGASKERDMVAAALAGQLAAGHSDELKAFLCRQLQLCGGPAEVPALAKLLGSDRLCEPATQAMLTIGGDEATAAFRRALPGAKGKRRAAILKALGRQRDAGSAAAARQAADDAERDVRLMAFYVLGNCGGADAGELLLKAAGGKKGFERTQAVDAALRLARRLGEQGDAAAGGKLARGVLAAAKAAGKVHERSAALHALADICGVKAVGEVTAAMGSDDLWYRNAAARTAVRLARAIRKDHKAEAARLLEKVAKATQEQAVLRQAERIRAGAN